MVWWGGCQTKPTLHPPPLEVGTQAWGVQTPPPRGCHSSLGGLDPPPKRLSLELGGSPGHGAGRAVPLSTVDSTL
jgi:hypothetical protein